MKTTFSEILSEIIAQSEISKNEMIRVCDIDRSSFFKFLNGSRVPTLEQFNRICEKLQFSPLEEKRLRMEYARITTGEEKVLAQHTIVNFLWKIEEMENIELREDFVFNNPEISCDDISIDGKSKVIDLVINTIREEAANANGIFEVNIFLPPAADEVLDCILKYILIEKEKRARIRQLIELPSRHVEEEKMITDRLRYALLCKIANPSSYNAYYYYANTPISTSVGILYAYFLITEHKVILFNERMNKAVVITDLKCCEDSKDHFIAALNSARSVTKRVVGEELNRELMSPILYCYGIKDGLEISAGDNMIRFLSMTWIKKAALNSDRYERKQKTVSGMDEKITMLKKIKDKLGSNIYIVDERNIPSALQWCIALSGDDKMIISEGNSDSYLIITEPELVKAFNSFMKELPRSGNLLRNDLAIEIIDDMIEKAQG